MPCLRVEEEQIQEIAEHQPARLRVVEVRRGELLGRRAAANRSCRREEERDAELLQHAAVHLGEAHLQQHLLALAAARHLQQVDDRRASAADACAISPARSMTLVLDTWPDRIVASSLALTWMSSPGNSVCKLLLQRA